MRRECSIVTRVLGVRGEFSRVTSALGVQGERSSDTCPGSARGV